MKVLNSYEFGRSGKKSSYDWDMILDGQIRQMSQGEDFECKLATFCTLARKAAKDRGLSVRLAMDKQSRSIVVQSSNGDVLSVLGEEDITPDEKPPAKTPARRGRRGRKRGS